MVLFYQDDNDNAKRNWVDSMTRHEKVISPNETVVAGRRYLNSKGSSSNRSILEDAMSCSCERQRSKPAP